MNEIKHSPLPFALCGDSEILSDADTYNGQIIAETHLMHGQQPEQYKADAEFIVLACNAYYDLLAACKDLLWSRDLMASCQIGVVDKCQCEKCARSRARAAIAKATGEPQPTGIHVQPIEDVVFQAEVHAIFGEDVQ